MYHCEICGKEYRWAGDFCHPITNELELVNPEIFLCCNKKLSPGFRPSGFVSICGKGDYYHVSESLGIIPEQAEEHRKYWPNVDILPGGKLGFHSVKEQQRYANHFGMDKQEQKRR